MKAAKRVLSLLLVLVCLLTCIPMARSAAAAELPEDLFLTQEASGTCTLCSTAMMIRSCLYIHGNDSWSTVTESSIRTTAWINGVGLKWNFKYTTENCVVEVAHRDVSGVTADGLKALLDQHPEGIVLYCGNLPHAVLLTDYEGDTFYCAETVQGYSGKRIPLTESWIGVKYLTQDRILANVTAYWYIDSYEGFQAAGCDCSGEFAGIYVCTTASTDLLIRGGHGTGYSVVGSIPAGATVTVTKATGEGEGDWAHVYYEGVSGYAAMQYLEKTGESHRYEAVVNAPTCTEAGSTVHTCADCGHSYTDTPVEPLGHDYGAWMPGESGKEVRTCSRCGAAEQRDAVRTGTVTDDDLRIRAGAGTGYEIVGYLMRGDRVEILETKTVSGMTWGRTEKGWISLDYVDLDEAETEPAEPEEDAPAMEPMTVTVQYYGVNIRKGPGIDYDIAGQANKGKQMTITEVRTGSGYTWGKFDGGWIALMYTNYEELLAQQPEVDEPDTPSQEPETPAMDPLTVTVQYYGVNIRKGPGTNYGIAGQANKGDRMTITEVQTGFGYTWGKFDGGWIALMYTNYEELLAQQPEEDTPPEMEPEETTPEETEPEETTVMGTITGSDLRIRAGAGTSYSVQGFLQKGDRVEILETKTVNGMTWGRIEEGWISLSYVDLDEVQQTPDTEPEKKIVTVTADCLRVRSDAGVSYSIVGYLYRGAKVEILETKTVSGVTWGRTEKGWISMDYVS